MRPVKIRNMMIGQGMPKICGPIAGITEEEILNSAKAVRNSCAQMAELRIDWYKNALDTDKVMNLLGRVRKETGDMPLIFTFRTDREGGETKIDKAQYELLNKKVIESRLADLLDVEWLMGEDMIRELSEQAGHTGTKIILSSHNFQNTPPREKLLEKLRKMGEQGGDILKLAVMPKCKEDVLNLLWAAIKMEEESEKPVVTMSMGKEGLISRAAGEFSGSAITFGCVGRESAPGQIHVDKLDSILKNLHQPAPNLFFIGFMGAGKSTIAKEVAARRKALLIEMDEELVERAGMPVTEIFEKQGEEGFRDMEGALIKEIQEMENCVVSCGGGAVLREENVAAMKKNGRIIFLEATPETIYERVKDSSDRPILNGNMTPEFICSLMEKRSSYYKKAADDIISTDGRSIEEICGEIYKIL